MEAAIKGRARVELIRAVADRIVLAKQTFLSRTAKFDGTSLRMHWTIVLVVR